VPSGRRTRAAVPWLAPRMKRLTPAARNMGIGAKVLVFIQHFCTGHARNDGLVICCNPYP